MIISSGKWGVCLGVNRAGRDVDPLLRSIHSSAISSDHLLQCKRSLYLPFRKQCAYPRCRFPRATLPYSPAFWGLTFCRSAGLSHSFSETYRFPLLHLKCSTKAGVFMASGTAWRLLVCNTHSNAKWVSTERWTQWSTGVKKEWSLTSTPSMGLHCVDEENFTFLLFQLQLMSTEQYVYIV